MNKKQLVCPHCHTTIARQSGALMANDIVSWVRTRLGS